MLLFAVTGLQPLVSGVLLAGREWRRKVRWCLDWELRTAELRKEWHVR